jgi:Mn-dependent DtxR family transcriptional regulator
MHLSAPSITEALRRMQREGYVASRAKKEIRLTTRGWAIAETMARRHRLLERWLTDVLGLDWSRAHDEAHRLEHALSPVVEERLAQMLGMPSTCPHGNPIPGMPAPEAHHPDPAEPGLERPDARRRAHHRGGRSRPSAPAFSLGERDQARHAADRARGRTVRWHHLRRARGQDNHDGLAASHKIWVYDPKELQPKPRARSARTAKAER